MAINTINGTTPQYYETSMNIQTGSDSALETGTQSTQQSVPKASTQNKRLLDTNNSADTRFLIQMLNIVRTVFEILAQFINFVKSNDQATEGVNIPEESAGQTTTAASAVAGQVGEEGRPPQTGLDLPTISTSDNIDDNAVQALPAGEPSLFYSEAETKRQFDQYDTNKDDMISLAEYRNNGDQFHKIDTNSDDLVTQDELINFNQTDLEPINQRAVQYLDYADTDKNGEISYDEYCSHDNGFRFDASIEEIDVPNDEALANENLQPVEEPDETVQLLSPAIKEDRTIAWPVTEIKQDETVPSPLAGTDVPYGSNRAKREFIYLDKDANGSISKAEIINNLTPSAASIQNSAKDSIAYRDQNQDGQLSMDEYYAPTDSRFNKYDIDNDGSITKDEMISSMEYHSRPAPEERARMDTDRDGKVSEDEFMTYQNTAFNILDVDGNGRIDKSEQSPGAYQGELLNTAYPTYSTYPINSTVGLSESTTIANAENFTQDTFNDLDQNGDDQLSPDEYRNRYGAVDQFKAKDMDSDGWITIDELIKSRMPDMEKINSQADYCITKQDTDNDQQISFQEFFPSYQNEPEDSVVLQLSRESFDFYDKNSDGRLSKDEVVKGFTPMGASQAVSANEARPEIAYYDQNGDDKISLDEFTSHNNNKFNAIDTNNDKLITKQEMIDEMEYLSRPGTDELKMMDTDSDGDVTKNEFLAYQKRAFQILDVEGIGNFKSDIENHTDLGLTQK